MRGRKGRRRKSETKRASQYKGQGGGAFKRFYTEGRCLSPISDLLTLASVWGPAAAENRTDCLTARGMEAHNILPEWREAR